MAICNCENCGEPVALREDKALGPGSMILCGDCLKMAESAGICVICAVGFMAIIVIIAAKHFLPIFSQLFS